MKVAQFYLISKQMEGVEKIKNGFLQKEIYICQLYLNLKLKKIIGVRFH